jgi:hypothetical protein
MFGTSKSRVFKPIPFGASRRRKQVPAWALGASGLYFAQEKLLPARLSFPESQEMKAQLEQATKARDTMAAQLAQANTQLTSAQDERSVATARMNTALGQVDPLKKDLDLFLKTLPPDPRGNALAIRAGMFSTAAGKLNYHVLFTRAKADGPEFRGMVQLVVAGNRGGRENSIELPAQPFALDAYQHVSGALALPEGFTPREVSVKVLRSAGGAMESLRVFRL